MFYSRPLPEGCNIKAGSSFAQDAKGNWFLNVVVEIPDMPEKALKTEVGVDPGFGAFLTLADRDGNIEKIPNPRFYRKLEEKRAIVQRAGHKKQYKNINAKIKNCRADHAHKTALYLVRKYSHIKFGNMNLKGLAKTRVAKSVYDAGFGNFKRILRYKAIAHGVKFEEVDERFTTQTCSSCHTISGSSPKGMSGLGIREWVCSQCGARHDRDANAATNILG